MKTKKPKATAIKPKVAREELVPFEVHYTPVNLKNTSHRIKPIVHRAAVTVKTPRKGGWFDITVEQLGDIKPQSLGSSLRRLLKDQQWEIPINVQMIKNHDLEIVAVRIVCLL